MDQCQDYIHDGASQAETEQRNVWTKTERGGGCAQLWGGKTAIGLENLTQRHKRMDNNNKESTE